MNKRNKGRDETGQVKKGRRKRGTVPCFAPLVVGISHEVRLNEVMSGMKTDYMIGYILINGIACNIAFYPVTNFMAHGIKIEYFCIVVLTDQNNVVRVKQGSFPVKDTQFISQEFFYLSASHISILIIPMPGQVRSCYFSTLKAAVLYAPAARLRSQA